MSERVLIVGGGISGLVAGVYARRAGFEAEIYEQNALPGGECTGWDRQGYHIDNCVHWLIGTRPGSALNELWNTVGALGPGVTVRRADQMYTSCLSGERLTLWQDAARTRREMLALAPQDAPAIRRLLADCGRAKNVTIPAALPPELMGPAEGLRLLLGTHGALALFRAYKGVDTAALAARFSHPLLRCAITDFCTPESVGSSFPMAYGNFIGGDGGLPAGGSRGMALRMAQRFQELGGRLFCGRRAEQILLREGRAVGLRLAGGAEARGDWVIPACDLSVTFGRLLPAGLAPPLVRRMYEDRAAWPVYNTFQAAYAADCEGDPIGGEVMFESRAAQFAPGTRERVTVKAYPYEPGFAPPGKQIVQVMLGGGEELFEFWKALGGDPAAYRAKKRQIAAAVQAELEARFPACAGRLSLLDTWTPLTYQRWCGAFKGFYQAPTPTPRGPENPYPSAFVQGVEGLVLAGQGLNPPGGLPGAATAGKFAVQRLLHRAGRPFRL